MKSDYYVTAKQAANALGVSLATLYAYASRGQLRSESVPGKPRERRYIRDDITRLQERKAARRDPSKAAARGLQWGEPVLESSITFIHGNRFYYRGNDAIALAKSATVEEIAALLWEVPPDQAPRVAMQSSALDARSIARVRSTCRDTRALMQAVLPIAGPIDAASYDLRPVAVRATGARILRLLTSTITDRHTAEPVHRALQEAWAPRRAAVADVIRTALVLCADHELNVSAFAGRCAASAGASPYDVVAAALATLKGHRHGGAADRVMALARHADTPRNARAAIGECLRQGQAVAGFGHPLYPAGDPRAALLIELASASGNTGAWRPFRNLLSAGADLLGEEPSLDFGLAAVARTYRLPNDAPFLLFALGRVIGWIAHAMEEYASNRLIRPRARYTGPAPALESITCRAFNPKDQ